MRGQRLDRAERWPGRHVGTRIRQLHRHNLGAQRRQHLYRGRHRLGNRRNHALAGVALVITDPQPANSLADPLQNRRRGFRNRRRIVRIVARDHLQHCRRIPCRARHRPHMVQRLRQRQHSVPTDPPPGRFQPHDSARRGRRANRASRVAAQRGVAQPRRRRRARTARRHPRPAVRRPRIDRHLPRPVVARHRALGQVELAQQHRPRRAQPRHHGRIEARPKVFQHLRPAHRRRIGGEAEILHCDRHAMQRPAVAARGDLRLRPPRLRER